MSTNERKNNGDWTSKATKPKHSTKKKQEPRVVSKTENVPTVGLCKSDKKDFRFKEPQIDKARKRSEEAVTVDTSTQTAPPLENYLQQTFDQVSCGQKPCPAPVVSLFSEEQARDRLLVKLSEELARLCRTQVTHPFDLLDSIEETAESWPNVPACCKR